MKEKEKSLVRVKMKDNGKIRSDCDRKIKDSQEVF
ncbi:MAG: hypothetical protein QG646_2521 [Euryarchaeota archaeon]|jgi:hypothetical protein|nr:hypothetical protein [Euryarchaeota archaeon]